MTSDGTWISKYKPFTCYTLVDNKCVAFQTQVAEVAPGKELKAKATKLTEGHKYHFRVVAENSVGVSEPCETDDPITAKLPFGEYF